MRSMSPAIGVGLFMRQQHRFVGNRDHVVMEHALFDDGGVLFEEHRAAMADMVLGADFFAGDEVLARGRRGRPGRPSRAVDEYVVGRARAMVGRKAHVVGSALIFQNPSHGGKTRMQDGIGHVRKNAFQGFQRILGLDAAVQIRMQVGGGDVQLAVAAMHRARA